MFDWLFGSKQESGQASEQVNAFVEREMERGRQESERLREEAAAKPFWLQAERHKEFMAATAHMVTPGSEVHQKQQAIYNSLVEQSKQAGEAPGQYARPPSNRDTFCGLPRITMDDLAAREERLTLDVEERPEYLYADGTMKPMYIPDPE